MLAKKENVSVQEIEEMQKAICCTGIDCTAEEFIKAVSAIAKKDYI